MVFLVILGIIDIVVGIGLVFSGSLEGVSIIFYLAMLGIIKGIYSIISAIAGGFYYDLLGFMDLVSGILLYFAFSGSHLGFFFYIGLVMVLKGLYSMAMGFTSR